MKKYKSSTFKIVEKVPTGGGIALTDPCLADVTQLKGRNIVVYV